ncbi:hypothetical protein SynA1544_00958 [Synechococcus sp. A15-44]|nr:hypothetical protein SynA1544_00958 [Synechococcus sp. A15-44]
MPSGVDRPFSAGMKAVLLLHVFREMARSSWMMNFLLETASVCPLADRDNG